MFGTGFTNSRRFHQKFVLFLNPLSLKNYLFEMKGNIEWIFYNYNEIWKIRIILLFESVQLVLVNWHHPFEESRSWTRHRDEIFNGRRFLKFSRRGRGTLAKLLAGSFSFSIDDLTGAEFHHPPVSAYVSVAAIKRLSVSANFPRINGDPRKLGSARPPQRPSARR